MKWFYCYTTNLLAGTCLTLSVKTFCETTKTDCRRGRLRKKRKPFLMFYIYPNPNSSCVTVATSSARAKTQQNSSIRSRSVCLHSSQLKQSQCCLTQRVHNTEGHQWVTGPRWNIYSGSTYCKATLKLKREKRLAVRFWWKHTLSPVTPCFFLLFFSQIETQWEVFLVKWAVWEKDMRYVMVLSSDCERERHVKFHLSGRKCFSLPPR